MKKKKILMVHNYYQIGGGEHTVFENEVKMLRENGHEVITYTRHNDELKTSKIKLLLLPFTTLLSFKSYFEVRKIIKKEKIDIVHCHNTFPLISPSVYYAARSLKTPVVQTIHNFRFLCPNGTFYCNGQICEKCKDQNNFKNAIKNKCYRNSKLQTLIVVLMLKLHRMLGTYKKISYIFLTEFNKSKFEKLIDINSQNVFVKPNFVQKIEVQNPEPCDKIKFVFAGRLEENKGVKFLLDAWKIMPSDYFLHIYGDGSLKTEVEQAAKKHSNIVYLGFKPQKEIFEDLSTAKALLFPSNWYEGFPMIIAESFSIGIPVISTDIGNQKDLIESSKGGGVFSLNDKNSFKKAIENIIVNNGYYSKNSKKYYYKYLTDAYNYEILYKIYENVS